jgi:CheY-like chemotaxis protein
LPHNIVANSDPSRITQALVTKRIFQIAYTEKLRSERAELLRSLGYRVISVIGNESAKAILRVGQPDLTLFIVGHAAPEQTRTEMVDWLKANYPNVRILALNEPNQQLPGADYNGIETKPDEWLQLIWMT